MLSSDLISIVEVCYTINLLNIFRQFAVRHVILLFIQLFLRWYLLSFYKTQGYWRNLTLCYIYKVCAFETQIFSIEDLSVLVSYVCKTTYLSLIYCDWCVTNSYLVFELTSVMLVTCLGHSIRFSNSSAGVIFFIFVGCIW